MSDRSAAGNFRGGLLMTASMAGFALEDLFVKAAAQSLPVGQVLAMFGAAGMAFFAALAWARGEPALPRALLSRPLLLRAAFEATGRGAYALAIALTPLSSASAILQAAPLVVTLGAAAVFGERVGWRRWLAILAGFAGVMAILRPGLAGFEAASLFAVLGMLGFAARDLATRAAPPALSNAQLGVAGFAVLIPTGAVLLAASGGAVFPDVRALGLVGGAALCGAAGYFWLTAAMRTGEVGAVTPFRYTRLVFAMALGVLVLGERPDAATLGGAALVIASGLYTLLRERRLRRNQSNPSA
ncbi:MAG: DMT family transporter [Rubrimonas sp.]|uniref:DMT family transporter n=1 Tax=Rubrimonas sp. TaxID=2036015 RepID=UPI002FDDEF49